MKPLSKRQIQKRLAKDRNFSEASMKYAELRESDLFQANFFRADLEGADMEGCDLVRAKLLEANLEGVNLVDAQCGDAYFEETNLYRADMEGCDLRRADLKGANLRDANLTRACLERVDMERVQAAGASFTEANLYKADLSGANLSFVSAEKAIFLGANLTGALMKGGNFRFCNFAGAILEKADLENADLRGADFTGANITGALFDGCKLDQCILEKGIYPGLSARWVDFSPNGDGSERYEFGEREMSSVLRETSHITIEFEGELSSSATMGLTRLLVVMETILPEFTVRIDSLTTFLDRTRIRFDTSRAVRSSTLTFGFFLIHQFVNGEKIDCARLETMIIDAKSPLLAALLLKKRPLSSDIVAQILKMKKAIKENLLFFRSRLLRFRLAGGTDDSLIMARTNGGDREQLFEHQLIAEETSLI